MAVRMAKLERDPKTGSWKSRKVIPADVKEAYGKANETPTWPATKTPAEAKAAYMAWLEGVEARITQLRNMAAAEPVTLTHKQVQALAGAWYQRKVATFEDEPGDPLGWEAMLDELEPQDPAAAYEAHIRGRQYDGPIKRLPYLEADLETLLAAEGLSLSASTRAALLDRMHELFGPLCRLMARRANGDYGADRLAAILPAWEKPSATPREVQPAVSLMGIFDRYVAERQPSAATVKAWRRHVEHLKTFVGHDDATRVSTLDVLAWKDALLARKTRSGTTLSAKTVGETYIAAARTVFGYGLDQRLVAENPVTGVRVRGPKKTRLRDPGLTDGEAKTILEATLKLPTGLSPERARALRWVPWLCAYSGARVNEMTQLRREDVTEVDGVWVVHITPEAGSTKDSLDRMVPIHSHLIEQGFLEVVQAAKPGPLFYDPKRHRGGSEGNPQSKKVGEALARWVREVGVTDPNVQPNHGWRHRLKTVARVAGIDAETRDAIQGHSARTEGEKYGVVPVSVRAAAIEKLPRYVLEES